MENIGKYGKYWKIWVAVVKKVKNQFDIISFFKCHKLRLRTIGWAQKKLIARVMTKLHAVRRRLKAPNKVRILKLFEIWAKWWFVASCNPILAVAGWHVVCLTGCWVLANGSFGEIRYFLARLKHGFLVVFLIGN